MLTPPTDWHETIPEGEAEKFERHAERLRELQRKVAKGRPARRTLHPKVNIAAKAEFTVLPDLPEFARVGLFATAKTYPAWVRVSNGAVRRGPDTRPDVRGIAVKIVGVEGKKLIPGMEDAKTQDFLAIRGSAIPFAHVDDFLWLVFNSEPVALLPLKMLGHFGLKALGILKRIVAGMSAPMTSVATTTYSTNVPIRFGPYAAKLSFLPHAKAGAGDRPGKTPEYLAEDLVARLAKGPLTWDVRVHFYRDEKSTPIEDASVVWAEMDGGPITVGRLTLPQQEVRSPSGEAIATFVETLSFDPWHALVEHRPLGNVMRARSAAYRMSTQERGAAGEPDGSEKIG